jgi:katanin p60 ATPase-containing subunit A1
VDFKLIGERLEGYSGSDVRLVCKEAAMKPLRRLLFQLEGLEVGEQPRHPKFKPKPKEEVILPDPVAMIDLEEALKTVKKSPGLDVVKYQKWNEAHGSS